MLAELRTRMSSIKATVAVMQQDLLQLQLQMQEQKDTQGLNLTVWRNYQYRLHCIYRQSWQQHTGIAAVK